MEHTTHTPGTWGHRQTNAGRGVPFPFPWALTQPHGIYVALGCSRSPVWGRPVASMGYAAIAKATGGAARATEGSV